MATIPCTYFLHAQPECKEERCFSKSDPETRKVVYNALLTVAKYVVRVKQIDLNEGAPNEDAVLLMWDLKAVGDIGVDPDEWAKAVKQTLIGKPKPLPWVDKALAMFENNLRESHANKERDARKAVTDNVTTVLAEIIKNKSPWVRETFKRAADLAIAMWIIVSKETSSTFHPETCPDRYLVDDKLLRFKIKGGTMAILIEMASEFPSASVFRASWGLFNGWINYYKPYLETKDEVPLSPKAKALDWMRSYVKKANMFEPSQSTKEPQPGTCSSENQAPADNSELIATASRAAAEKLNGMQELWRDLQRAVGTDDLEDAPGSKFGMEKAMSITDRLLVPLEGKNAFDKLTTWMWCYYSEMPDGALEAIQWSCSQMAAMFCLFLTTESFFYNDLASMISWLLAEDETVIRDFLLVRVLRKKKSKAAIDRSISIHMKVDLWLTQSAAIVARERAEDAAAGIGVYRGSSSSSSEDTNTSSDSEAGGITNAANVAPASEAGTSSTNDEFHNEGDHYDYGTQDKTTTTSASEFLLEFRKCIRRPAHILCRGDLNTPSWFHKQDEWVGTLDEKCLADQQTVKMQILNMEVGGAFSWLERLYHPLADWESHVHMLIRREMLKHYKKRSRPNLDTIAYRANINRLKECVRCFENNEVEGFIANMGVFTEDVFKNECEFECSRLTLSGALGEFLENVALVASERSTTYAAFSGFEARKWPSNMSILATTTHADLMAWCAVIKTLASWGDHVAVLVVDALCWGLVNEIGHSTTYSIVFPRSAPFTIDFTDHTAPLLLMRYWDKHPALRCAINIQAAARKRCLNKPRFRFANTTFTVALECAMETATVWAKINSANLGLVEPLSCQADFDLCKLVKTSLDRFHCRTWRMRELVWGGCALIRYAEQFRSTYRFGMKKRSFLEDVDDYFVTARFEIDHNLDMAEVLLTSALDSVASGYSASHGSTSSREVVACQSLRGNYTSRARKFLRELRDLRSTYRIEDAKHDQRRALAIRQASNAALAVQRKLDEDQKREVGRLVSRVIVRVRSQLNSEWSIEQEEIRKLEQIKRAEELREAERVAKEAKRKVAERKAMVKRVIEMNREAAERREAHLAERAVIEKKAGELEKKQEADRAKKRERKQWEAERAKRKAEEEEERAARSQREVEAEQRARERRRDVEVALGNAAAMATERERVANVERARREREAEEVRQREEADLQRALQESEATRVRDESATNAYYSDGVPQVTELERRADQSRFDRMVVPKVDALRETKKRAALTKALARWRDVAERKREAKREAKRNKAAAAEAEWHRRQQEVCDARVTKRAVERELDFMEKVLAKLMPGPKLQQEILEMRQVLRVAQATIKQGEAGPSEKSEDRAEKDRQKKIMHRLMQRRIDRMYNKNRALHKRALLVGAMRLWRIAAERKREWNASRSHSRNSVDKLTYQLMSKVIHSWRDVARALKTKRDEKQLVEERLLAQEHCNSIFREETTKKNRPSHENAQEAATPLDCVPPPLPPLSQPSSEMHDEIVTSHAQWCKDYHDQLKISQWDSKQQWEKGTGWAAGAHTVWRAFGGQDYVNARVRERQQWDAQSATFWANSRHMERVRQRQIAKVDEENQRLLKEDQEKYLLELSNLDKEKTATLQAEHANHETRLRDMETWFASKLDTIASQNLSLDSYEAENHTLVKERASLFCSRLRARLRAHEPNAETSRLADKHECVVCLDATCTHVATTCGHVIGCAACCAPLTACPICCATTSFVELRFPH